MKKRKVIAMLEKDKKYKTFFKNIETIGAIIFNFC